MINHYNLFLFLNSNDHTLYQNNFNVILQMVNLAKEESGCMEGLKNSGSSTDRVSASVPHALWILSDHSPTA